MLRILEILQQKRQILMYQLFRHRKKVIKKLIYFVVHIASITYIVLLVCKIFFMVRGFGLPPIHFLLDMYFCFKYTMINGSRF